VTGQDGAYLAQLLLSKNYLVFGGYRHAPPDAFWRLRELGIEHHPRLRLRPFVPAELDASVALVEEVAPDEIYNLAAPSFLGAGAVRPDLAAQITALGALNLLEAIRVSGRQIRFFQASSAEQFGATLISPQTEETPFQPRAPYGVAKLFAHWMTVNYRQTHGIFGSSGILFNHESPLRGLEFVTRKITSGAACIRLGKLDCLELGNLSARRDWGFAPDYVEGMWRMLQAEEPDTFVLATNRVTTVRDFVRIAFEAVGIAVEFEGLGEAERGIDRATGRTIIRVDRRFYRPVEAGQLIGDASKARAKLAWAPRVALEDFCLAMVDADLGRQGAAPSRI
jgi:GDPmannose 4,6-dehydratase